MAKLVRKIEPTPAEFIISINEDEARFLYWLYDEMRVYNPQHYTERARNIMNTILDAVEETEAGPYDSAFDYVVDGVME